MAATAQQAFNKELSLFSSLYLDAQPTDLPAGLSPDNQNLWYLPGSVSTRPAVSRLLGTPLSGDPVIMSVMDFPLPTGGFETIFVDSTGKMWQREPVTGVQSQVAQLSVGARVKSATAFTRQWYAGFDPVKAADFSASPFVGTEVPLYSNGDGKLWRVTQDAPAIQPQLADESLSYNINASPSGLSINPFSFAISAISESGNQVTVQAAAMISTLLQPGDSITVAGVGVTGYNGTFTVAAIASDRMSLQYVNSVTGLTSSSGGTVTYRFVEIDVSVITQIRNGLQVTVAGASNAGYNGTYTVRSVAPPFYNKIFVPAAPAQYALPNSGGGTVSIAGNGTAGVHNAVLMFESLDEAITAPSIPVQFISAGGTRYVVTNLAIGPPNTRRRIIAMTPAGGGNYYYVPPTQTSVPQVSTGSYFVPDLVITQGTIIDNNTDTSGIIDVSDAQLVSGVQIDIEGNNLFEQIVLAPCLSVIDYQGRLMWCGEINNIKNMQNMGFEGGRLDPLFVQQPPGWDNVTGSTLQGATIVQNSVPYSGWALFMRSAGGAYDSLLSQPVYQDFYGAPIAFPGKRYTWRFMASMTGARAGDLVAEFYSPTGSGTGVLATATIDVADVSDFPEMAWITAEFDQALPDALPNDLVFRFYFKNVTNGQSATLSQMQLIDAGQPVLYNQMRASYANNPFGYDALTGLIGFETPYSLSGFFRQRGYLYVLSTGPLFVTQNDGQSEPAGWSADEYAQNCSCSGPLAIDYGVSVAWWTGRHGVFVFSGQPPKKLSQELQPLWDSINWNAELTIWLANDPIKRMVYIGVPQTNIEAPPYEAPNIILPMSYRLIDAEGSIPDPLHISSYSGKVTSTDLCRKWTIWTLPMNCAALCHEDVNSILEQTMVFGCGTGQRSGVEPGFGELYVLDFDKFTDDDYGIIDSYYTTYFFFQPELEEANPEIALHRKLLTYLSAYVTGTGRIFVTPLVDKLGNAWQSTRQYQLTDNLKFDLEWPLNVRGDRFALKIQIVPLPVAAISRIGIQSNVLTLYLNQQYNPGTQLTLSGITNATFLNGQTITVVKSTRTQVTANFTHADYPAANDTGTATPPSVTDAYFNLTHLVLSARVDPTFPVRGAIL